MNNPIKEKLFKLPTSRELKNMTKSYFEDLCFQIFDNHICGQCGKKWHGLAWVLYSTPKHKKRMCLATICDSCYNDKK